MKKSIIAILVILFLIVGYFIFSNSLKISHEDKKISSTIRTVEIGTFDFSPTELTINRGESVKFTNDDAVIHSVSSDTFESGSIEPKKSFSHTFDQTGIYNYHCRVHPTITGKIIVK